MHSELVKAGVVYGLIPSLPTYGQPESPQPSPAKLFRGTGHGHAAGTTHSVYIMELSFSAANFFVCGSFSTGLAIHATSAPIRNFVAFDVQTPCSPPTPEPRRQEPAQTHTSPVVLISARASDRAPTRRYVSIDLEDFQ